MMSTNDLRSNDLEKEFSRIETHARAKFEHEEFLHSAQHWKNCSSIAKELRRDDLRALAYRHLSFALRGCGQNTQADEAYRRAMKYETRAAPTSPNNNSSNNIRVPPSIAASSTESPRGTVKLLQSSINHHTHHHQDIDHHHVLLDTKVEQRDYLTGEEYEQGLQSLAEANARLRDQLETLQQQHKRVLAVQHETTETSARTRSEVERLSRALDEERDRCIVLDDELRAIKKATDTYKDSKDRECRMYEGTIEELQEQLKKQVAETLQQQDTIMSLEESVVVFKKEQETAKLKTALVSSRERASAPAPWCALAAPWWPPRLLLGYVSCCSERIQPRVPTHLPRPHGRPHMHGHKADGRRQRCSRSLGRCCKWSRVATRSRPSIRCSAWPRIC